MRNPEGRVLASTPLAAAVLIASGVGIAVVSVAGQGAGVSSADWPQWRGPARDAAVGAFVTPSTWPEQLTRRWNVPVGLGYATPLLVGGRLYQFSRQNDDEVMTAIDAASGAIQWRTGYPA